MYSKENPATDFNYFINFNHHYYDFDFDYFIGQ
jgi:hypothetical protein